MTTNEKTRWCFSIDEAEFQGEYDSPEDARAAAEAELQDLGMDDKYTYAIATIKPAHEMVDAHWLGDHIEQHLDELLSDDIGWDDSIVELKPDDKILLGRMVIEFVRKVEGFRAYGVRDIVEHTYGGKP